MVRKLNVWVVVTVLCITAANGFKLSAFDSSEETDNFDFDIDSSIDESDYWNLLSELSDFGENGSHESVEDEKWNQLDNLELIDEDIAEVPRFSEVNGIGYYQFGHRVRGICLLNLQLLIPA